MTPREFERKLKHYLETHRLFTLGDTVLLAVSGGLDSMALLHALYRCGYRLVVVHCNFGLRGEESDGDEAFVREQVSALHLPFYTKRFDTETYAQTHQLSTQMAARELRYKWFEEMRQAENCQAIATAHHLDDQAETLLLNFVKGAMLEGLRGMQPKNGHITRPLLWASREEIAEYAQAFNLQWREDSSNASDDYQRNFLRHQVLPLLREINPSVTVSLGKAAQIRTQIEGWWQKHVAAVFEAAKVAEGKFKIARLQALGADVALIWTFFLPYGFNVTHAIGLLNSFSDTESGVFFADKYRIIKDRAFIYLDKIAAAYAEAVTIDKETKEIAFRAGKLAFKEEAFDGLPGPLLAHEVWLDVAKLQYPLFLRKWQQGDRIRPLGMIGTKLVSDILIDAKASAVEKENQWVLCSGDEIVWVLGRRVSEDFKLDANTKRVLKITLQSTSTEHGL